MPTSPVAVSTAAVLLRTVPISDNSGGGIFVSGPGDALEIENTILKAAAQGANISNNGGTVASHGYNVSSDDGGGYLTGTGDQINTDPLLGPLQDNGGSTFTHELLKGSPAIDAGDPDFTPPPYYDQRGPDFWRLRNDRIDIGSFEVQASTAPTATATRLRQRRQHRDLRQFRGFAPAQHRAHSFSSMKKKRTAQLAFFNLRTVLTVLVSGSACFIVTGTMTAFFRSEAPTKLTHRTLTFVERVAYQRAIEEVYWQRRIWPKKRPDPKPPLDAVMSQAQLEKKVTDYLRDSQALEDSCQRSITTEQLQTEMDRMAQHTKQPEMLRELFEALGNDPFVIAECLARPTLSERLVTNFHLHEQRSHGDLKWCAGSWRESAEYRTRNGMAAAGASYRLPTISDGAACIDDTWTATSTTNNPTARASDTAVWTGSEMIVWGGYNGVKYWNTGGRYNPSTDSWTATSTINAPDARASHTAVWTGSEMIVWGGYAGSSFLNTGGKYNPGTDSWTATSTTNAPAGRQEHTAIWTGSEMIVWGGFDGTILNTGGRYNPGTDSWTATSTINAPAGRQDHTAVWTGSEMIVWGGFIGGIPLSDGGRYNPGTDTWTATSTTNVPPPRGYPTAVWTGSEMIVWGGWNDQDFLNTGGIYNPSMDSWTATSTTNAPDGRFQHTAVWTGSEMIVWGGWNGVNYFNTGGRYNPTMDTWTATSTTNAPSASSVSYGSLDWQ